MAPTRSPAALNRSPTALARLPATLDRSPAALARLPTAPARSPVATWSHAGPIRYNSSTPGQADVAAASLSEAMVGTLDEHARRKSYEPREGGHAFERVDTHLAGMLLAKAANTSAPGDDRISADTIKVFWQWDRQRITQLMWACIRLGHHPKLWKTAKGVGSRSQESRTTQRFAPTG